MAIAFADVAWAPPLGVWPYYPLSLVKSVFYYLGHSQIRQILGQYGFMAPSDEQPADIGSATTLHERQAVFQARGVTKVYHMGEVAVHALQGVDLDLWG